MITTRLIGGLGNHMFQYAAGKALAMRNGMPLRVDRRRGSSIHGGAEALDVFALTATEAGPREQPRFVKASRLLRNLPIPGRFRHFKQASLQFDTRMFGHKGPAYLDGFWQTERYFADAIAEIRSDFRFRSEPAGLNARLLAEIAAVHSVSLHVRRGDYVKFKHAADRYGSCDPRYYREAVSRIAALTGKDLVAYIFSDDPDWASANLHLDAKIVIVRHNSGEQAFEDMRLMAQCRHHVIANSTFSWWGAWLDPRAESITIAPDRWYADPARNDTEIIPPRWLKLANQPV